MKQDATISGTGAGARRNEAFRIRQNAAIAEKHLLVPAHRDNGDEAQYPNRIGRFSKGAAPLVEKLSIQARCAPAISLALMLALFGCATSGERTAAGLSAPTVARARPPTADIAPASPDSQDSGTRQCALASGSGGAIRHIVQSSGDELREVDIVARAFPSVGKVLPVQLAVSGLVTKELGLDAKHICAKDLSGQVIGALSPTEAEAAAGGDATLAAALERKNLVHTVNRSATPGGAEKFAGSLCQAATEPSGGGAMLCVAGIAGALIGEAAYKGEVASSDRMQVEDLSLPTSTLLPGTEAWGYVFFPVGTYSDLEVPINTDPTAVKLVDQSWDAPSRAASHFKSDERAFEVIEQKWNNAADLAAPIAAAGK